MRRCDVAIIGAGMAGASLAAELAPHCTVLLAEAEDRPGYHATGRSAAFWTESYGGPGVQPLTSASGPWLGAPPARFGGRSFLSPRGALHIARAADRPALAGFHDLFAGRGVAMQMQDRAALERLVPGLQADWLAGVLEPSCQDIDVAGLHAACLAAARAAGAELAVRAPLRAASRTGQGWRLSLGDRDVTAALLVNAAGAWADAVAATAGVAPLGIRPLRRTMVQLRVSPSPPSSLPLVLDIGGRFYFKPEQGRLWLSPHDETPQPAGDAAPEEIDVARAVARLESVLAVQVEAVEHRWAGLRSFAPDRLPVIGFDPADPAFFWFAGQGGFGIQTAPAAAAIGASALLGRPPAALVAGVDRTAYDPARFGRLLPA